MSRLPECPFYVAHPQAVWFEEHWRPLFDQAQAQIVELMKQKDSLAADAGRCIGKRDEMISELMKDQAQLCKENYDIRRALHDAGALIGRLQIALESYAMGWIQMPAHKNKSGFLADVWKNNAVQNDHGLRAEAAILEIKKWSGK